jgi:D-3-phosphoglycerate dehydrogenase
LAMATWAAALPVSFSGFQVNVIAYDKYKTGFSDKYAREVSMEEIVKHSDVLSLHIPLTPETNELVDDEYLFHFKKPIFFLNTSRGKTAKVSAVLERHKTRQNFRQGLDVLEVENSRSLPNSNGLMN